MTYLLKKLNYKGQERIAIINADESFTENVSNILPDVRIDKKIDPRFPYGFIILFVKEESEVENLAPLAIHNLVADGILWFCYPKKSSKKAISALSRDYGWKTLNDTGFYGIRMISIDETWSALRFRNIKYIKSVSGRFQ